jgi:hypothetical protein
VFYFLLPHYAEGQTQFGIVRSNLTPRPAFVALAAVGRLLAGAKPLGRVKCNDDSTQAYLFKARPDGQKATVVVAWSEQSGTLELPTTPLAAFDHLGRRIELPSGSAQLSRSPIYILLPQSAHFSVTPPPEKPPRLKGRASPIVFQAMIPEEKLALESSACRVRSGSEATIPFFAYNFSTKPVRGALQIRSAEGWSGKLVDPVTTNPLSQVEMLPGDRKPLSLIVQCKQGGAERDGWVRVEGDFRSAGRPIVSVRLTAGEPGK